MRLKEALMGLGLLVVSIVIVASVYPVLDDFWAENPGWNGLSEFYQIIEPVRVKNLNELSDFYPLNCTLFLVGPSRGFSDGDIIAVEGFLESGGRVVLLDDFGSGNELLEGLGLDTRFNGSLLRDGVFFDPMPEFPRLLNFSFHEAQELVLNYGTVLDLGDDARKLISSSPLGYLNTSSGFVMSEYPVVAEIRIGSGVLMLVADSSVWLNSMIDRDDNLVLVYDLLYGTTLIDVGHSYPTRLLGFQWMLEEVYAVLGLAEVRYFVGVLLVVLVFRLRFEEDSESVPDFVGEILNQHPEWSKEQLKWLREQQRKQ